MRDAVWRVSAKIKGPIDFVNTLDINGVEFRSGRNTITAKCRIYATNSQNARDVAIRNISDILDVISFLSNQHVEIEGAISLQSEGTGTVDLPAGFIIKRVLDESDINQIENLNNIVLNAQTTDYGRALSYYRKGLGSVDPFDSFVSFWQAIEIVLNKYPGNTVRNRTNNFFNSINIEIPNDFENYRQMRNNIVHGTKPRDIEQIRNVSDNIEGIKRLANLVLQKVIDNPSVRQTVL